MEKFRNLKVWEKAHQLTKNVYNVTEKFPKTETYGLSSQMRRAAVSVVANIVEGSKRRSPKDQGHFFLMSDTSLEELKYYFILSEELHYLSSAESTVLLELAREVGRMLTGLSKSLSISYLRT